MQVTTSVAKAVSQRLTWRQYVWYLLVVSSQRNKQHMTGATTSTTSTTATAEETTITIIVGYSL